MIETPRLDINHIRKGLLSISDDGELNDLYVFISTFNKSMMSVDGELENGRWCAKTSSGVNDI